MQNYFLLDITIRECLFEIRVNDIPVLSKNLKGQTSTKIPINYALGARDNSVHSIEIKMLPILGEFSLGEESGFEYRVMEFDVTKGFDFISQSEPVDFINSNKLSLYVHKDKIEAKTPRFIDQHSRSTNLEDVDDIKAKLINASNDILKAIEQGDFDTFEKLVLPREQSMKKAMWLTDEASKMRIKKYFNIAQKGFSPVYVKDAVPVLFHENKGAVLRNFKGDSAISLYNEKSDQTMHLDMSFHIPEGKGAFETV